MKPNIRLIIWLFCVTTIVGAISCNKDKDDNTNTTKTKTELLTAAPWKRTALISTPAYDWNADGTFATDLLTTMWSCEKDNLDIYKTNGIFETNEGATKCNPSDPQSWTVTWVFAANETKLIFDGTDEYTIVELTETTLKYQSTFVENGVTYTHVETYGH